MAKTISLNNYTVRGVLTCPSDKSISHRALMFASISEGKTVINRLLQSDDCQATKQALIQCGIKMEEKGNQLIVYGQPLWQWSGERQQLNLHNSGTSMRLLLGLLANKKGVTHFIGDSSLNQRPMKRVIHPLENMGAMITSQSGHAPLSLTGQRLHGICYTLPVASAQVKSAIILAGIHAEGDTFIEEPIPSRDHTERMLPYFNGKIIKHKESIMVPGNQYLKGTSIKIPGDISSAAFFMTAAVLAKNSQLTIKEVGLNETRIGFLNVLQRMGANIDIEVTENEFEPIGTIQISSSNLKGVRIDKTIIPTLIDELPLIALLATQAKGETIITGAEELAVKECNRLEAVATNLNKMGADITVTDDGWMIKGETALHGASLCSYNDHRIAMMAVIASLISQEEITIDDINCISVSYPNFFDDLYTLIKKQ